MINPEKMQYAPDNYKKIKEVGWRQDFGTKESLQKFTDDFDDFIDQVLVLARHFLEARGIKIAYTPPEQRLGIKESWRCIKIFSNNKVYYRIGKTKLRKGPYQGKKLLFIDLVMDGQKRKVFLPLLSLKRQMERKLGEVLERELPSVEATGKYRLKLFMPFWMVERGDVRAVSRKLSTFILVTQKTLHELGVGLD